ncbi:structural maintenance of chromosomes flexible hinge domain-containing protein 1 [Strongylocentrotus purpuratus]|uniref:SMC hinge domain-containing protein n=1 Tax=Strongylocentrotus purpuratus TaxID=7668 RepID=A0A7M7N4D8_STRPU|nr:structural maintenance of chromosomes flexible hinge domain-containing protein 1 [Strongylocentrotus purpuratus]
MAATMAGESSTEEDSTVYVFDRRRGSDPERKIALGGVFSFADFKDLIKKEFGIPDSGKFVIATTNRDEINTDETYEELVEDGDTLYLLVHLKQALLAPTQERVEYQPHFDTLIRSGMYEYYASEGQNPLPFAIAELIDNSLAATVDNVGPRNIEIRLYLDETGDKSMVCVLDNGKGMTTRELNNWAIYRLSKFNRKRKRLKQENNSEEEKDIPRSLNSDISYFGVGGKQAVFFIGDSTRMISKPRDSKDVHEMAVSKEEFERREKNKEDIYKGIIHNRQPGEGSHISAEDEILQKLVKEEEGKENFTHVVITSIKSHHIKFLKEDFSRWSRQLAHIYHYYIHGPQGNQSHLSNSMYRTPSPYKNIDISITTYKKGHTPRQLNLRDIEDDHQSNFIRSAKDTFEFRVLVEGTGLVEGVLRYHPFLFDKESYPADYGLVLEEVDDETDYNKDRPARGSKAVFECYWNGRLIPYTLVQDFDWCALPKKRVNIPAECYNRVSGALFANSKFEVSTNKLTFIDFEMKLRDKSAVFQRVVGGQPQRVKIDKQFTEWLHKCHETHDKQVCFRDYVGNITRPDLPKKQQGPWAVFKSVEWDGKVYTTGQQVRTLRTSPILHGAIQRFLLLGDFENEIQNGMLFATGGEFEIEQEPRLLYNETKIYPLRKLDRLADERQIKKYIDDEEGKLPGVLVISWPEANEVHAGEKRPAGKLIGAIKAEIHNRKGQSMSRLPGAQHNSKKLMVEMKIIWHSNGSDKVIVTHMSQHHKTWSFWFKQMDIVRNIGPHTLILQAVLGEEGATDFGGRSLPSHKIKFTSTEGPPSKFSIVFLDPPFRVDVPFNIPLQLQDEFNYPTKPTSNLKPVLEASGLEMSYEKVEIKGTSLIVKGVKASGDVGSAQGKNFNMTVMIPGLEIPTQQLKIRILPGEPHKIVVPTFEETDNLCIENGKALPISVEIRDGAGNFSMHPKLVVQCKFLGAAGLPLYTADCSNSGKATLTGNPIFIKNISKKSQKITARIELPHMKGVSHVEKAITVKPSTGACKINVFFCQHQYLDDPKKKPVKMKPQEEIEWTAGENTSHISFALFDEGDNHMKITKELANKFKFNWLPSFNPSTLMEGYLPPIKVPNTVGDSKFCQLRLTDGSGLEFSFNIKPIPGKATQIKCQTKKSAKVKLGEILDGDIVVHVTDAYGNSIKKLPHGSLSSLSVEAEDLDSKVLQKALLPNVGFGLRNIKFDGSTVGVREVVVTYNDFTDHIRLEVLAGRPAKLLVIGWMPEETLIAYDGAEISNPLGFKVCDESGNHISDANTTISLQYDKTLKVSSTARLMARPFSDGQVTFGKLTLSGPCGKYMLHAKMSIGRSSLMSSGLAVQLRPDPKKAQQLQVDYKKGSVYIAGDPFPDFDISVIAADESTMTNIPHKKISMRLWKSATNDQHSGPPPQRALITDMDKPSEEDREGHFYCRKRKLPQEARMHWIIFQASLDDQMLYSEPIGFDIQPGPPVKLIPEIAPPTPTVSNTPRAQSRTLIKALKLQLVDEFGNLTGKDLTGNIEVHMKGNNGAELPKLQGNKSMMQFPLDKGIGFIQNISIQEDTPGHDGSEYKLHFTLKSKGPQVKPYIQPFLFYNDAKKQQRMSQLSKERDTLSASIRAYKSMFEGKQELLQMFKESAEEAAKHEIKLRGELRIFGVRVAQIATRKGAEEMMISTQKTMEESRNKPRRKCGMPRYETRDGEILGKVAHLVEIEEENDAYVLSWHMASDMDCVLTTTVTKAKEVFANTRGRQQVLPIESIYKKGLTEWDKPLPHKRVPMKHGQTPSGNPVYARHLLKFTGHEANCRIAFSLLLQDTVLLDTLDDATAYRQSIVKHIHCPTLLTRDGNRIRGNGKFGGFQNRCPSDLRGCVFGEPPPKQLESLEKQMAILEQIIHAIKRREQAQVEYKVQEAALRSGDMVTKQRDCQEDEEQLALINQKLKLAEASSTDHSPIPMSTASSNSRGQSTSRGTMRRSAPSVPESPRTKRRKP